MSWNFDYGSCGAIKMLLEAQGMAMCKKFGQNFLITSSVRERIVDALKIEKGMHVWEIGPGIGSLSSIILERGAALTAFEIDRGFAKVLGEFAFADEKNFSLVEGDALKTMGQQTKVPDRICGNLPYNVGTHVIVNICKGAFQPSVMVFMLQKEVVARITARPGSADWGALAVICQINWETEALFDVKPGNFYPQPNVVSRVVRFEKRETPRVAYADQRDFIALVNSAFAYRRKTLKNNFTRSAIGATLKKDGVEKLFERSGIQPSRRAESLNWEEFIQLYSAYKDIASCLSCRAPER